MRKPNHSIKMMHPEVCNYLALLIDFVLGGNKPRRSVLVVLHRITDNLVVVLLHLLHALLRRLLARRQDQVAPLVVGLR